MWEIICKPRRSSFRKAKIQMVDKSVKGCSSNWECKLQWPDSILYPSIKIKKKIESFIMLSVGNRHSHLKSSQAGVSDMRYGPAEVPALSLCALRSMCCPSPALLCIMGFCSLQVVFSLSAASHWVEQIGSWRAGGSGEQGISFPPSQPRVASPNSSYASSGLSSGWTGLL